MGTKATPSDMHSPMYLLANLATQTSPGNNANAANVPITSYIDYIRVYSAPNTSPSTNAVKLPSANSIGAGPDQFKLSISEDAFNGDAQYTVSVDGVQVGGVQTAHTAHASGQSDLLLVQGSWGSGAHDVAVQFLNDAYAPGVGDRNLYIDNASYHGVTIANAPHALLSAGAFHFDI